MTAAPKHAEGEPGEVIARKVSKVEEEEFTTVIQKFELDTPKIIRTEPKFLL